MHYEKSKRQQSNILEPDITKLQKILNGDAETLVIHSDLNNGA